MNPTTTAVIYTETYDSGSSNASAAPAVLFVLIIAAIILIAKNWRK